MTTIAQRDDPQGRLLTAAPAERAGPSLLMPALQLLLILLVVRAFGLEERRGLFGLLLPATLGALVHQRLPERWRPSFFLLLSLAGFPLAFAWPRFAELGYLGAFAHGGRQSAWVFALGLVLIGICHLPLRFAGRVVLLGAVALGLVVWRSDAISPFWAVLGSVFMFRLWIYLAALRRESTPAPWSQRLSYFFLFSNGFFPFFPLVDYRKFRSSYVACDDGTVMQRGIAWIVRGIVHLLLYRVVKIFFLPGPMDLIDAEYLALFLVTNYALYLRISGHFHIITGVLHLFGYALPRTHDRYFLASSLSDIWRRINIYWKDFLTDHVFFPAFFSLRRLPKTAAVFAGVLVTFAATWFLHSWQAFWLLGSFPLDARDAALWLSAGTLVAINSLWQYRRAQRRVPERSEVTVGSALRLSIQVAATFLTVSFFWACWTVPFFPQLVVAVAGSGGFRFEQLLTLTAVLVAVVVAGTIVQLIVDRLRQGGFGASFPLERSPALCIAALGLMAVIGMPQFQTALGPPISLKLAALSTEAPTAAQLGQQVEGYYEALAEANLQADPLLGMADHGRPRAAGDYWEATRSRPDALATELIPGWRGEVQGVPFHVNRWGMRDDDLPRRKPPGTYRIAVLGSSVTMGYGVRADAVFESLLEDRLNAQRQPEEPRVELLNFAVGGYYALHSALAMREKAFPFDPDAVYYIAHQGEFYGPPRHLAPTYKAGHPLPYPCLESVVRRAGVTDATSWGSTEILLQPYAKEIVACIYGGIVDDCRRRGILPVWIYIPMPGIAALSIDTEEMLEVAREAGFIVIDLSDWADGYEPGEVKFTAEDYHANELGHRIIAERLDEALRRNPEALPPLSRGLSL